MNFLIALLTDNLFDKAAFSEFYTPLPTDHDYNAYWLRISAELQYWQTGLLPPSPGYGATGGNFYLPANSPLINAGSRPAVDAGLSDYTQRADQTPDSGTVDIGFHYPILPVPTACTDPNQTLCVNGTLYLCGSDPQGLPLTFLTVQAPA